MAKKIIKEGITNAPDSKEIIDEMNKNPLFEKPLNDPIKDIFASYKDEPVINTDAANDFVKEKKRGRPSKDSVKQPEQINNTPAVSGALMLLIIDLAIPNVIAFVNNKFNKKGKKIKPSMLQMSEEQRKELTPLADQVAKEVFMKANPLGLLLISMIGIYGINFIKMQEQ